MRKRLAVWMSLGAIAGVLGFALWTADVRNSGRASGPRVDPPAPAAGTPGAPGGTGADTVPPRGAPPAADSAPVAPPQEDERIARGRELYEGRLCARCHSVAGRGNPRSPLDGVGARRDQASLRDWMLGLGAAADSLSSAVVSQKAGYRNMPAPAIEALVAYLASLTEPG